MNKFRIIVAAVFLIAALYGVLNRLSSSITVLPWWKSGAIILITLAIVFFLLSGIKRSAGKLKQKNDEKAQKNTHSGNVKN